MKKILFLFLVAVAGMLSSCDDFLSVESPDKITSDSFWRNQTMPKPASLRPILSLNFRLIPGPSPK